MAKNRQQLFEKLEVIDAGAKGKTIAKAPDGRVVFLNNAVPGDVVDVRTYKKRKAYFEGTAIKFHTRSPKRTEPTCSHFGTCGGCKWQHMDYTHQLHYKQKEVENNLTRIGHLELPKSAPILGSKKTYLYRNKMEFSFSDSRWLTEDEIKSGEEIGDRNALGFHIPGMWDKIMDIEKCHLQADPSNAIRNAVKTFANQNKISFYSPKNKTGLLRTLMIRTTSIGEVMVLIQFFEEEPEQQKQVLDFLKTTFPEITALLYVANNKANDSFYDLPIECYSGRDHIFEEMEGLRFKIHAKSFYQTNSDQAYELYKIVRQFADLKGDELIYDLYTGTGTIALFLAKNAKKIVGIEAVPDAILDAKANATANKVDNTHFFAGDMRKVLSDEFIAQNGKPDLIITDPPREGMHPKVVKQILNIGSQKIVYVSCNSATQARDLALLDEAYKITKVQPVDMFPQTHHVENVVLLEKR